MFIKMCVVMLVFRQKGVHGIDDNFSTLTTSVLTKRITKYFNNK